MAFEPEFREAFTSSITWESYSGEDEHGNNTYAAGQPLSVRVDTFTDAIGTLDQQEQMRGEIVGSATIYAEVTSPVIKPKDKVTLSTGEEMYVQQVVVQHDEDGPHHLEVQAQEEGNS